jgi:HK97 gp10 family phage protein
MIGLSDLTKQLRSLADKEIKAVARRASKDGIKPAIARARIILPKKTGVARASVASVATPKKLRDRNTESISLGVKQITVSKERLNKRTNKLTVKKYKRDGDAFYVRFMEYGTKYIARRNYLRNAFASSQAHMLAAMRESISRYFDKRKNL